MKQMHNSKNTSSSSPRLLLHVVLLSTALCSTANAFEFPNPFANKAGGASLAIKKMNPVQSTVRASILFVRDDDDDDLSSVGGGFGFFWLVFYSILRVIQNRHPILWLENSSHSSHNLPLSSPFCMVKPSATHTQNYPQNNRRQPCWNPFRVPITENPPRWNNNATSWNSCK